MFLLGAVEQSAWMTDEEFTREMFRSTQQKTFTTTK